VSGITIALKEGKKTNPSQERTEKNLAQVSKTAICNNPDFISNLNGMLM
jgi:hypothetical protein